MRSAGSERPRRRWRGATQFVGLAFAVVSGGLQAQAQGTMSAGQRADALVARGDSGTARRLADSLVAHAPADSPDAAAGLYWRGALARSADSARIDLSRVVVDHAMRAVAGDALFRLALLDLAAGDRAGARRRLVRAERDYGMSATAGDAALALANLLMADGAMRDGCAALDSALQRIPADQVEKRNRVSYLRRPCAQVEAERASDTAKAAPPETKSSAPGASRPPARGARTKPTVAAPAATNATRWSVQVGAFASQADAERTSARLTTRGYEARVTGERPFRVRIGRYAQRADAVALMAKLKGEKITAFLVEAERP
jgi:cell division septation protein DedD